VISGNLVGSKRIVQLAMIVVNKAMRSARLYHLVYDVSVDEDIASEDYCAHFPHSQSLFILSVSAYSTAGFQRDSFSSRAKSPAIVSPQ
jgi:hypothetical protein